MTFNYNPDDRPEDGEAEFAKPGVYEFVVDDIRETTFSTGSEGWNVRLMVGAFDSRDIKVYDNIVNTARALWKMEQFLNAFGLDFNNIPSGGWRPDGFIGQSGKADFVRGARGYLEVKAYLPAKAGKNPAAKSNEPPPHGDSDAPF
jgi:hypothetical protein